MRLTVWKYPLDDLIDMPKGAKVIAVQSQSDTPCLWVVVDKDQTERAVRRFMTYGTGHDIDDGLWSRLHYIGTYQSMGGTFVGHVFEIKGG